MHAVAWQKRTHIAHAKPLLKTNIVESSELASNELGRLDAWCIAIQIQGLEERTNLVHVPRLHGGRGRVGRTSVEKIRYAAKVLGNIHGGRAPASPSKTTHDVGTRYRGFRPNKCLVQPPSCRPLPGGSMVRITTREGGRGGRVFVSCRADRFSQRPKLRAPESGIPRTDDRCSSSSLLLACLLVAC